MDGFLQTAAWIRNLAEKGKHQAGHVDLSLQDFADSSWNVTVRDDDVSLSSDKTKLH